MLQRSNTGSINVLDENAAFRTVSPSPRGPDQIHGLNAAHVQGGGWNCNAGNSTEVIPDEGTISCRRSREKSDGVQVS